MTPPPMVERAARALKDTLDRYSIRLRGISEPCALVEDRGERIVFEGGFDECQMEMWKLGMRAAIAAMRVPTDHMLNEMAGVTFEDDVRLAEMWRIGIDAALDPAGVAERG